MIPGIYNSSANITPEITPPLVENEGSQTIKWLLLQISDRITKFPDQFNAHQGAISDS